MSKNNEKYLQGISFSQLTVTKKTEIKNLGSATRDLSYFSIILKQNTNLGEKT
jgi:hypothetical protein